MSFKAVLMQQPRAFAADGSSTHTSVASHSGTIGSMTSTNLPSSASDSLSQMLISHRLNGNNYLQWSRCVLMLVRGRNKERYLTGQPSAPSPLDASYDTWCAENNLVMAWLVNSMVPEISENYLLAATAKEIWDSAKTTYSVKENTAALTHIKRLLRKQIQGEQSVIQYYTALMRLWQQVDLYEVHEWTCSADALYYKRWIDRERSIDFLLGLNDSYEDLCGRIMSMKPTPSLDETFNMIKCEESRKILTQSSFIPSSHSNDSSALALHGSQNDHTNKKSSKWCDHCKRKGHMREECWKLHGKPSQSKQKPKPEGKGLVVGTSIAENASLSPEELMVLRKILDQHAVVPLKSSETSTPSVTLAQAGTVLTSVLCSVTSSKNLWIVDSGATDHITGFKELFSEFTEFSEHDKVEVANGQYAKVYGSGTVIISKDIVLYNVLYVPNIKCSLLSVRQAATHSKCLVIFDDLRCVFQDSALGRMIGSAKVWNGLYYIQGSSSRANTSHSTMSASEIMLWHSRLGHPNFNYMQLLFPAINNKNLSEFHCDVCHFAKQVRNSYPSQSYMPSHPFNLIHSDVWGPSKIETHSKARWFVTFIDDHTRLTWVFLMKDKSEVFPIFKNFLAFIKNQFHTSIKILRTDNGKEYLNSSFKSFLDSNGIHHQTSCVYSPQQNGIAERKNRHLLEVARALMIGSNVPHRFWGDAILTATHLINRMPSKPLNFKTPVQSLLQNYSSTSLVTNIPKRVFGCTAFVYNDHGGKLDSRAIKCIFLGYSSNQKGYKCYCPITHKVYITMNVKFMETQPYYPKSSIQGESERSDWIICDHHKDSQTRKQTSEIYNGLPTSLDVPSTIPSTGPNNSHRDDQTQPNSPETSLNRSEFQTSNPFDPLNSLSDPSMIETMVEEPVNTPEPQHEEERPISTPLQNHDSVPEASLEDLHCPIALRKGKRSCTQHPIGKYVSYGKLSPHLKTFVANVESVKIPKSFNEAIADPNWKQAIEEELRALHKNRTWKITDLPKEKSIVSSKWVFTVKYNPDGSINKYKARLVARGFTQTYGIDYQETFAPVAKLNTINVLLSLAANLDWPLHQLDIKNAFLNGDLEEEVYMEIPLGLRNTENSGKVCRLYKSLYGLKQSPRAWFERFSRTIKGLGYKQCQADDTLFIKHYDGKIIVLAVYVDDIVLTGDDVAEIEKLKQNLATEFEIKDLGPLRYFLGMEVARTQKGISVSQRKYTLDLLKETGMLGARPVNTPMELNQKLTIRPDDMAVNKERYQRLVGKLIYLSHTRPDICFPVSVVSQFSSCPQKEHMAAVYRILRYLKKTPGQGLFFAKGEPRDIELFTDADWAGSKTDRRSTTGYCSYLWGNLVTWRSKKQSVVSRSSAESEYRALALGICEGIWLLRLLKELKIENNAPIKVWCDNISAIKIANNPVHHDRTKHVEIDRHFIKEKLDNKMIDLSYIPSRRQVADVMTKSLTQEKFEGFISKLGMINIYSPA